MDELPPQPSPEVKPDIQDVKLTFLVPTPSEERKRLICSTHPDSLTVGDVDGLKKSTIMQLIDRKCPQVERVWLVFRVHDVFDEAALQDVVTILRCFVRPQLECQIETSVEMLRQGLSVVEETNEHNATTDKIDNAFKEVMAEGG